MALAHAHRFSCTCAPLSNAQGVSPILHCALRLTASHFFAAFTHCYSRLAFHLSSANALKNLSTDYLPTRDALQIADLTTTLCFILVLLNYLGLPFAALIDAQLVRLLGPEAVATGVSLHHENVGGSGTRTCSLSMIKNYLVSDSWNLDDGAKFRYVAQVDDTGLKAYPYPHYVHVDIPLVELFKSITLTNARKIASTHGIAAGSRCTMVELLSCMEGHSCRKCTTLFTVFSVEMSDKQLVNTRVTGYREKKKNTTALAAELCSSSPSNGPDFPPGPASPELTHTILTNACKKMFPGNLEEDGCAICGELKPVRGMSSRKAMKNYLKVLETPGAMRAERKHGDSRIKDLSGPVIDHACTRICDGCRAPLRKGKVPRLALANNLWIGKVPDELKNLRYVEKILIARVRHTCAFVKVASGMRKMKANIIAFESPIPKVYSILPPPRDDLDDVLAILFTGPTVPTPEDFARTPFLVRRNEVIRALEWLKLNHADYTDIEISQDNMNQYDKNMPPVSVGYRPSTTNKVSEGTSVFDQDEEDGTEEGDCAFTVHGLTGEALQTMTPNAVKGMALRHLANNGKMLMVGHSDKFESMWNNPQLYPQMFPWLFPYGLGGVGAAKISHKEHKRHLLMYHDKRFQTDINFPFVAFSHEQMRANTTQSFLLVDQRRFGDISERLMQVDWNALDDLAKRMEAGERVTPESDAEKRCFQLVKDLDAIMGKMHGSTTSKKFMRSEIWSLINYLGAPYWYITLSPADIQHPICIYYAGTEQEFKPALRPYDERIRSVCRNPVAGARFFHFMVETFITDVLGINAKHRGLYGETAGYYGTVEQQGRLTLHLHMLLWIKGGLTPQEMRDKIMKSDAMWQKKLIDWLESCHTGDFLTGKHADVAEAQVATSEKNGYMDPTQTLPVPPPKQCKKSHTDSDRDECEGCEHEKQWGKDYASVVDDLLLRSNVHSCTRGTNKDGTRRKNKASASCTDNKWGKCKARFPRMTFVKTFIDETAVINLKKVEAWLNTITPLVTYIFRCNTDVTSLSSGTAIKGVVLYVSDYITKSTLKTHVIFDSI